MYPWHGASIAVTVRAIASAPNQRGREVTPDPTKVIREVRGVFPLWDATPAAVRELVTNATEDAAGRGGVPVWALPAPQELSEHTLRLRRMALLFLLGLPGETDLDLDAERIIQQERDETPYSVDEILRRARDRRNLDGPSNGVTVFGPREPGGRLSSPGYIVTRTDGSYMWNIANLADGPLPLPDGSIVLASDDPAGPADPTSDNDMLPGLTTIWFAPK